MDEKLRFVIDLQNKASAELRKLSKDLDGVKPGAGAKATASWFQTLEGASTSANKALRPLASGLGTIGVSGLAAGLSVAGLITQFRDLAKAMPALQELSRQTGISKTELERLKQTAANLNIDPSKMTAAIGAFSAEMVQFSKQSGEVYAEMQNGASGLARKIASEWKDHPEQALKDYLGWLAEIPAAAQRAGKSAQEGVQIQRYWAQKGLGDADMAQIVGKGMGGFQEAYRQAAQDVGEITDEMVRQSAAFDRSITRFDASWNALKRDLGAEVLPALTATTDGMRALFDELKHDPELIGIGAASLGALYARRRMMRAVGGGAGAGISPATAAKVEGAAVEQKSASASFAEAVAEFKVAVAEFRAKGGPAGAAPSGGSGEPGKPGGASPGYVGLGGRAALALYQAYELAAGMPDQLKKAETDNAPIDPQVAREADWGDRLRHWLRPHRSSAAGVPAFHPDDDRSSRARASDAPDRSLDGFVVGALDKPVTHLVGTLKTAAAALDGNVRPAAFHPAGLGGAAALDPQAIVASGTKEGVLAAFREWAGLQDLDKGAGGGGGGFTPAAFHMGGMPGGYSAAAAGHAGAANIRYGRGGRTPGGQGRGDNGLGRFDSAAPGANGFGLTNAPYTAPLDAKGEGGHLSPRELFSYLKAHGATDNEATMLTGAAGSESSFNPNAIHDVNGRNGPGHGLWGHNDHRINMTGLSWQQQADRALAEVKRDYADRVNAAKTPEELADAEMHYERPRGYHSNNPRGGDNYTGRLNTLRRFSHGFGTMGFDPAKPEVGAAPVAAGPDGVRGHVRGNLKIGDETYAYGSGGVRGAAHVPYGDYPINPDSGNPWGRAHNAMDVNNNGSIWDASLGRMRTGIEMHVAHSANMVTEGCLSFLKDQYPQLKARVKDMVARTGHAYLHINEKGASITSSPKADQDDPRTKIAPMPAVAPEPPRHPADSGDQRAQIDPVRIDLHHHESGRTKVAAKTGRGVQLSIRTAPTMVQTS